MAVESNPYLTDEAVGVDDLSGEFGYKATLDDNAVISGGTRTPFARNSFLTVRNQPPVKLFGHTLIEGKSPTAEFSFNEMMGGLSTMTPDELEDLQRRLYYSGAYEDSFYKEGRSPSGMLDGETLKAYMNVLTIASREIGRGRSVADVLDSMAVQRADVVNSALVPDEEDVAFPTATVQLSDPAALADMVDKAAKSVLGKKVSAADRARLVAAIQGAEVSEQTKSVAAADANRQRSADAKAGATSGGGTGEATFNQKMAEMEAAAKEAGHTVKVGPGGGKRTHQQQAKLYAEKPNLAAKPGSSNHEYGLAADLTFSSDAARQWAHQNAARFGLTFPMLGQNGGKNEPWHVELINAKAQRNTEAYAGTHVALPGMPSLHGDSTLEPVTVTQPGPGATSGGATGQTKVNPTQVVTETAVDPQARLEDMIRETDPLLAGAHDTVGQYAMFLRIMGIGGN